MPCSATMISGADSTGCAPAGTCAAIETAMRQATGMRVRVSCITHTSKMRRNAAMTSSEESATIWGSSARKSSRGSTCKHGIRKRASWLVAAYALRPTCSSGADIVSHASHSAWNACAAESRSAHSHASRLYARLACSASASDPGGGDSIRRSSVGASAPSVRARPACERTHALETRKRHFPRKQHAPCYGGMRAVCWHCWLQTR